MFKYHLHHKLTKGLIAITKWKYIQYKLTFASVSYINTLCSNYKYNCAIRRL